jgi:hypothetical protein
MKQDWVKDLPRHGGDGSLQEAMWDHLKQYIGSLKGLVSAHTSTATSS